MKISNFIDLNVLQKIQDQFSEATGLAAIAVDAEGNYITKGSNFTDFCMKYTRGCQEGLRRCVKCDNECKGTYYCHAGLMDFSSDIFVNGERVGSIIGGQVLPGEPDMEHFKSIARELGIDETSYIAALKKVPVRSEKTIRAAADMLGSIVNQLVNLEYLKSLTQKKMEIFDSEAQTSLNSVNQIKAMTKELQRVASMENILSINAAIEAKRAGKAGDGFVVVAREMGELSRQSSSIYNDIQDLVTAIAVSVNKMQQVDL